MTGEGREQVAAWMYARVKWLQIPELYSTLALLDDAGKICAAVMYENFVHPSIDAHIAAERLTPYFLAEALRYPFVQLDCNRIAVRVASDNDASQRFVTKIGFTLEGRAREALPGPLDVLAYSMLRRECRWLGVKPHGNQEHGPARRTIGALAIAAVERRGLEQSHAAAMDG